MSSWIALIMTLRNKYNTLDHIFVSQIQSDFYYEDSNFQKYLKKSITALHNKELIKLGLGATPFDIHICRNYHFDLITNNTCKA